jgi:hypothetical protein
MVPDSPRTPVFSAFPDSPDSPDSTAFSHTRLRCASIQPSLQPSLQPSPKYTTPAMCCAPLVTRHRKRFLETSCHVCVKKMVFGSSGGSYGPHDAMFESPVQKIASCEQVCHAPLKGLPRARCMKRACLGEENCRVIRQKLF